MKLTKPKQVEVRLHHPREAHPVKIVADGAISTVGLRGGRLLPVLLLDTSERLETLRNLFGFTKHLVPAT